MQRLEERLGYAFRDRRILEEALTHPSHRQDHPDSGETNQRLEFLGDAVLQLIVTSALFELFPKEREGVLSKRRSALTRGAHLATLAQEIGLDGCLRLGSSEESTGGREKLSALEDAFEALVGAIYLDGGLDAATKTVLAVYGDLAGRLDLVEEGDNPKGRLQEKLQPIHGNEALSYEVVKIEGAEHARTFEVEVRLHGKQIGRGRGSSKKLAEESAARAALDAGDPGRSP